MTCEECRPRKLAQKAEKLTQQIVTATSDWRQIVQLVVTMKLRKNVSDNAKRAALTKLKYRTGKLIESLNKTRSPKLLNSTRHVWTIEFQDNGNPHVHILLEPESGIAPEDILYAAQQWQRNSRTRLGSSAGMNAVLRDSPEKAAEYVTKTWRCDAVPQWVRDSKHGITLVGHSAGFVEKRKCFSRTQVEDHLWIDDFEHGDHSQLDILKAYAKQQRLIRRLEKILPGFHFDRPANSKRKMLTLRFPDPSGQPSLAAYGMVKLTIEAWIDEPWLIWFTGQATAVIKHGVKPVYDWNDEAIFRVGELKLLHGDISKMTRLAIITGLRLSKETELPLPVAAVPY